MRTKCFTLAFMVNVFVLCGTIFPDDPEQQDGKPPVNHLGWWEGGNFYVKGGNSSDREKELQRVEDELNAVLAGVPCAEDVRVRPIFGKGSDIWFILRLNIVEKKEQKPPQVKLFEILDVGPTKHRREETNEREKWFEERPGITLISDVDQNYHPGHCLTVIIYRAP